MELMITPILLSSPNGRASLPEFVHEGKRLMHKLFRYKLFC